MTIYIMSNRSKSYRNQSHLIARQSTINTPRCSKMVKSCNSLAELEVAILEAGDKLVVVDFFAEWCPTCRLQLDMPDPWHVQYDMPPCKIHCPEIAKLAAQEKDVVFLRVDITQNQEAAEHFCSNPLQPTFVLFKGGAMVDEVTGVTELKEAIYNHK